MYCSTCGAQVPKDAAFCGACGATQDVVVGSQPVGAVPHAPVPRARRMGAGAITAIIAGLLVAAAIGGGVYWAVALRPMNADDYKHEVLTSSKAANKAVDTWVYAVGDVDYGDDSDSLDQYTIDEFKKPTNAAVRRLTSIRDELDAIRPPKENAAAHKQLVEGVDGLLAAMETYSAIIDDLVVDEDSMESLQEDIRFQSARDSIRFGAEDIRSALEDMGFFKPDDAGSDS